MARTVSTADAKRAISQHQKYLDAMSQGIARSEKYKGEITTAVEKLAELRALEMLKEVPVEELNREKQGIRVKTLREHNYCTVADLHKASLQQLAAIRGISDDGARMIKKSTKDFLRKTCKEAKIRLSSDDRNTHASKVVSNVFLYKAIMQPAEECRRRMANRSTVEAAIVDAKPVTGGVSWLFASRAKKTKAEAAYGYLSGLMNGEYGAAVKKALQEIDRSKKLFPAGAWDDFNADPIAYFTVLEELCPGRFGSDDAAVYGLPEELALAIQEEPIHTEGLRCTLRRYQEWGVRYILHQKKVLLGDEMGLGKTVQAIAAMVSLSNTGETHFMVVCPASVVTNWCREIGKHSPLRVVKIHGSTRLAALQDWTEHGGVAVTTYETTGVIKIGEATKLAMMILDEAHYIKNPEARRTVNTRAVCRRAERLLFMTGTAMENKVEEMLELIRILQPGVASEVQGLAFMSTAPQFREKIAPVYYRRRRDDVLTELPELIEKRQWCTLQKEEERLYEDAILSKKYTEARRVSWNVADLNQSSKAQRLKEIIETSEADGRKIIVFSFFLDTIGKIGAYFEGRCLPPINGSVPPQRRQEIIDEFDKAPAGSVLLAQIQSGGTGLNIQSASVVVICEPQFKPSIENQAISRAYRMGQSRNVLVHRLLGDDTVDEKITQLLEQKQAMFDAFADESAVGQESLALDERTFANLMQEEAERIQAKREEEKNQQEG